ALHGLGTLGPVEVGLALHDSEPFVRQHALRLLEELPLEEQNQAASAEELRRLTRDPDARVRFQLALSLRTLNRSDTEALLDSLIRAGVADLWMRAAILNAAGDHASDLAASLITEPALIG